ncbi:pyocin knob domain-containing protein [Levilactobacillus brevis]|uniref:pyocin knob domain-containing protein n=1 Tax=Levilactobacillus brevis TaxID=1580 RepID=UPI0035A28E75
MEYNSKSLTREGATMLALADKEEKALIIDEVIVSEKVITAGTDISALTMADFANPLTYGISSKVQSDNQFSVKSVITNHWQDSANTDHTTNKDFNVALVGVVAHVDSFADQHVLTVAVGNDPFVLPAYQGTDVSFVFGITQAYSASQNVTIKMDGSAYALATDLDDIKNLQGSIGIAIDSKLADYVKTDEVKSLIPATVIDGSKPADFKESVTLEKGAVDGDGNAIATTQNLADGDAETLTSAKEYADAKVSGKADDSAVVHNTPTILPSGTDLNVVTSSGYYYIVGAINKPENADDWTIYQVVDLRSSLSNGVQIAYDTNENFQSMRTWSGKGWTPWKLLADDSKVVHLTDMRKPANQVASIDEVNAKQDKLDYTPANAANVVDRNPDTGTVSKPTDFTNLTVNGGKSVATRDDLKSVEASAWRPLTLANSTSGTILFKDNGDGTASLIGSATFTIAKGTTTLTPVITPPTGYTFTSLKWSKGINNKGVYVTRNMTGVSSGTSYVFDTSLSNGDICFLGSSDDIYTVTFSPSELTTLSSGINCNPALVSISKV